MSINTTSALASTDVVDTRATDIANQVLAGTISERDGRWIIVTDILSTDVVFTVARWRRFDATAQEREDLIPEFNELVQRKALQETEGGMDLVRIANGTSACGWARNLLRNGGMQSELRDMRRITNRNATIDPTLDLSGAEGGVSYADMAFHTNSVTPDFEGSITGQAEANDEMDDLQDEFLNAAAGKRSGARLMLAAQTMQKAFKFSAPIRPMDPFEREFVRNTVSDDENAAVEAVTAMHALITSVQTEEQRNIDPRMLALWDDYSVDELHRLSMMLPEAAQTLVLAAVALKPRPSRDHLANALWLIRHADKNKGWLQFTKRLFESWVAIEVEAVSEFSSKAPSDEDTAKRLAAALSWPELVAEAVAMPGQPLGASEREVSDRIAECLELTINA